MIYNLRYCRFKLFVYGWLIPMLISWVLRKSIKHSTNLSKKDKYDKDNLKAVFGLLELLVYIQLATYILLPCNAQVSYWFPLFTLFVKDLWQHAASKFFGEIDIFSEKMSLKRRRKIDRISWYYWICLELCIDNEHTCVVLEWELTLNHSGRARKIRVLLVFPWRH